MKWGGKVRMTGDISSETVQVRDHNRAISLNYWKQNPLPTQKSITRKTLCRDKGGIQTS